MNSEMTDLAREATTADGYHLMRGMTLTYGETTVLVTHRLFDRHDIPTGFWETEPIEGHLMPRSPHTIHEDDEWWPVLDDAATRGCLLEMVREVWGDPEIHLDLLRNGIWEVRTGVSSGLAVVAAGGTEASALVAALKAGGDQ